MKPRVVLVLAVTVALLGAAVVFWERFQPSSDERRESADRVLTFEPEEIQAIEIAPAEGETVRLQRSVAGDPSPWRLASAAGSRADGMAVDSLLRALGQMRRQRRLDAGDPGELGLDPPQLRLDLEFADGGRRALEFGAAVPGYPDRILRIAGEEAIQVVEDSVWRQLEGEGGDWRSRRPLPWPSWQWSELAWEGPGVPRRVFVRGDQGWRMEAPLQAAADPDLMRTLIDELSGLEVERFEEDVPAPSPESIHLEVRDAAAAGPPLELRIFPAGEPDLWWAAFEGRAGQVRSASIGEDLRRAEVDWVSPAWTAVAPEAVGSLRLEDGAGVVLAEFQRDAAGWSVAGRTAAPGVVETALGELLSARASRVRLRDPGSAVELPEVRIELGIARPVTDEPATAPAGPETEELFLGAEHGARSDSPDLIYAWGEETAQRLQSAVDSLREVAAAEPPQNP